MIFFNGGFLYLLVFIVFSIPASVIDIKRNRIPDLLVFMGICALLGVRLIFYRHSFIRLVMEGFSGFLIFFGIRFFTKGKLGMGDVKFAALMAVFVGFPGWFIAAGIASALGLVFAVTELFLGTIDKKTKIPFAPFLTAGSIGAYFVNYNLLLRA